MGAIASGGIVVINEEVVGALKIPWEMVQAEIARADGTDPPRAALPGRPSAA